MKKWTKALSFVLAAAMLSATLAACSNDKPTNTSGTNPGGGSGTTPSGTTPGTSAEITEDEKIYDQIFGEFYTAYAAAKQAKSVSERYALMAIAEAKLLESGAMMPMQANGGNYAISKLVPYTVPSVLWGTDSNRYHNALVCTEPLKTADREALKALWKEKAGTGTWEQSAKAWLSEHGYTLKDTYNMSYSSGPATFDLFRSSEAVDSEVLVNTYDGLIEYNSENRLSPALATEWSVSDDGLTWTFKLRKGAMWVDSTGVEAAEVKADDFLAGFQHMLDDSEKGLSWLVDGVIVGVTEYVAGTATFDEVGIKAPDDYTVQFTLTAPVSYFDTMLGYGVFAPMNRAYYESKGGKFGYANGDSGTYGTNKDNILYCGPYIISTYVENNSIVFQANEKYWNKDNINLKTITWVYNDGKPDTKAYDYFTSGTIDGCGLNSSALTKAKEDGNFETYGYTSSVDASSFPAFFNLYRRGFANYNDASKLVSAKTDEDKARTQTALLNQNFRLALTMSMDRAAYNEQAVGPELKYNSLTNSYTPGTFVTLAEDVTVKINGTDKTYKAGTYYGQIMQDQITADGYPMKVFDPAADGGIGSSFGYDGWYNVDNAKAYLQKAIEELKNAGLEITAEKPISLDLTYFDNGGLQTARAQTIKQSIEASLGGLVVINLIGSSVQDDYLDSTYYFGHGEEANYDINLNTGWNPDFGDPCSYLDTMVKGGGYMLKCMGLDA